MILHGKYEGIYTTERESNLAPQDLHFSFTVDSLAKPCKHPHTKNIHPTSWDNASNNIDKTGPLVSGDSGKSFVILF
jgi:hypothetical protein